MAGMKTPLSAGTTDFANRMITINVTGVCQQSVLKTSNYQVRVPYSQMSQTMQNIHRQGGKIASVQLMGNPPAVSSESATEDGASDNEQVDQDNSDE